MIFIIYEVGLTAMFTDAYRPFIFYFIFYSLNISFFYFHSLIVLMKGRTNTLRDIWLMPLLITLELGMYYVLTSLIIYMLIKLGFESFQVPYFTRKYILSTLWRGIYFMLYGTGYYFLLIYYEKKKNELTKVIENEKLKNDLLQAEQDFLRAQINPHLLFNTLSFIKYAAKKKPEEADEAVMRLSGIMGFALDSNTQTIRLTKELEQVENIIGLNQLRFNHRLHISYTKKIEDAQATIIPIVLLTLVENIFKHGDLSLAAQPAEVYVEATASHIILMTSNLPNRNSLAKSNHTGLANIKFRLNQAYPGSYEYNHGMSGNLFKVYIKINLQNN